MSMLPGKVERRSYDYYRHGTTTLFAALEIATGQVIAALKPKRRHQTKTADQIVKKPNHPATSNSRH
ncbi:hypothetical protein ACFU7D_07460 [Nocardioides sp. NPDC057577]|uniref:hypothetical protein n=1 Tax=Nocardioides sp. NPDC057577 TaxID=3346171 RepID=UPI00366FBB21